MAVHLRRAWPVAAVLAGACAAWCGLRQPWAAETPVGEAKAAASVPAADAPAGDESDPLGANAGCYVCHMTFVKEELAKVHLQAKVGCIKCHGISDKHANDENVGATKPDVTFHGRQQIEANCAPCHDSHDAPAAKVVGRFIERRLPAGVAAICTQCHGTHKIDRAAQAK